jgi:hypothetical protein
MDDSNKFIEIDDYKNDILRIISEVENKCRTLENIYKQYLQQATQTSNYLMSLDTLYFQLELTKTDVSNYSKLFSLFIYHMYGQYYKFYKKILCNLSDINKPEIFKDIVIHKDFTPYDDIKFQNYSFEEITSIHNLIISVITNIDNYIEKHKYEIDDDFVRVQNGITIDTLVFEKRKFNKMLENENNLFKSIKSKFYDYQLQKMRRIMLKLKLLYFQIDTDIQFESFNYSSRKSVTPNVDSKLRDISSEQNFESILLKELTNSSNVIENTNLITNIKLYILKFFSKFCIY